MSGQPKLIQVNIALFSGAYAEARRLLADVHTHEGVAPEQVPMVLWLDAQTQDDPAERLHRLRGLLAQVPSENRYAQMARHILNDEDEYESQLRAAKSNGVLPKLNVWQWIGLTAALMLGALLLITQSAPQASITPTPTLLSSATIVPTRALPDMSRALDPAAHTARYPQGILQIARVEDASQRVIDAGTGATINPVNGARFFALQIAFECRSGVCDQPPEAALALQIDDDTLIAPRTDVLIIGESALTPVALGRSTIGWIVFEIPLISDATALIITARTTPAADPISISLGDAL
ncbi:MAG: hypothetical protein SGI73_22275 [Chloroflexota bacterium]|nr:hypothetical protein [Chloroflexota bacterium]